MNDWRRHGYTPRAWSRAPGNFKSPEEVQADIDELKRLFAEDEAARCSCGRIHPDETCEEIQRRIEAMGPI